VEKHAPGSANTVIVFVSSFFTHAFSLIELFVLFLIQSHPGTCLRTHTRMY
jgi:hypothetical protein